MLKLGKNSGFLTKARILSLSLYRNRVNLSIYENSSYMYMPTANFIIISNVEMEDCSDVLWEDLQLCP